MPASITPFAVTGGQPTQYDSQGFINSGVIQTSPGTFLGAIGFNKGSTTLYVMWFNATAVPGNGATPAFMPVPVPPGGTFTLVDTQVTGGTLGPFGPPMSVGLCWAASTTPATLTVDTTNSMWITANFCQPSIH
jgi:hypothetical protein